MTRPPTPEPGHHRAGRRRSLSLGRISGFPLLVDRSWFLIALVIVVLYTPVLTRSVPGLGAWAYLVAVGFCLLLAASVLLHELAHAWSARAFGWPVTHITLSLMGGHTSFGHSRPSWWASLLISVAGPATNLVLGLTGWVVLSTVAGAGTQEATMTGDVLLVLVELTTWANLFVGASNLIPGMPLDGGRALEAVVWGLSGREHVGTVVAAWSGRLVAAVAVAWVLVSGLWRSVPLLIVAALLVWMLVSGASAALRRSRAARAMAHIRARDLMEPCIAVDQSTPLATVELLLREAFATGEGHGVEHGYAEGQGPVAVVATGPDRGPVGTLNPARITAVAAHDRPGLTLGQVMDHLPASAVLPAEMAEMELLEFTASAQQGVFVVVDRVAEGDLAGRGVGPVDQVHCGESEFMPVGILRAGRLNQVLDNAGLLR